MDARIVHLSGRSVEVRRSHRAELAWK